jgi:hypothetical protein
MKFLNIVLILALVGTSCAISHGENIVAYCISNNKYYTLPQTITADVAIDGVSLGRDYTIKMIVENELYAKYRPDDKRVTRVEGIQTKNCDGTHGGWMWFRSGSAVQTRLPQDAVPGCFDVTIELYSGRSAQPQNLLDKEYIPERFCAWTNGQPDRYETANPNNACSLADESDSNPNPSSNVPQLLSPTEWAVVPNGKLDSGGNDIDHSSDIEFDWNDVLGATMYHLYVKGATAKSPLYDIDIPQSRFQDQKDGHIGCKNRLNWIWKVKAYVNGHWYDYSPERHFDFEAAGPQEIGCDG